MPKHTVADLERGKPDDSGGVILAFYSRKPPDYAIYRTPDRMVVQYADAAPAAADQRRAMAALNPLRGEINGLIDGWRSNRTLREQVVLMWEAVFGRNAARKVRPSPLQRRAERYDRRVADALILGFENDGATAQALLAQIKQDILDERIAQARFEYLATAFMTGVAVMAILLNFPFKIPNEAADLLRAAGAGTVGAFFSIALAIRSRTVLPDLQRASNLMDAVLRVAIGLIAAAVLIMLMTSGAITLNIGSATLGMCDPAALAAGTCTMSKAWMYVLLIGFIAGFSERFVPDLLEKATAGAATGSATIPTAPPSPPATADGQPAAAGPDAPAEADDTDEADAHDDHCLSEVDIQDHELTADADLPAAAGGVARPETGAPA